MSRHRYELALRRPRGAVLACVLVGLAVVAGPVSAQQGNEREATLRQLDDEPAARVVQDREVSLEEAVSMARRRFEGQVVSARTVMMNGRRVHEIRIIEDGRRVHTVKIDAATGRIRR